MNDLKQTILEHARSEYQKDKNKELIAQKARERAERDKAIAQKGGATASEIEAEATGKNLDSNDFKRGDFQKNQNSPTKPAPRNMDDGFAIKRSDKPRGAAEEEAKKGPPTFSRGPPRNTDSAPDTGFIRGNFTKKTADEAPKKFERTERKPAAPETSGAGFGFRNSNATAKKAPAKK